MSAPGGEPGSLANAAVRIGIWSWSFIGVVGALAIVVVMLSTVSEIAIPVTFAAVLAVVFRPVAAKIEPRIGASAAAGLVVLALGTILAGVVFATVHGVVLQADEIDSVIDEASATLHSPSAPVAVDEELVERLREGAADAGPMLGRGVLPTLVSWIDATVAVAGGTILGALVLYYLLKDGGRLRRTWTARLEPTAQLRADEFIDRTCRTLRIYARGRSTMSAMVSMFIGATALVLGLPLLVTIMVVNFVGGYVPYIGAFLGGGLAVTIALSEGGWPSAAFMLVAVLGGNLVLENFVEPRVMGNTLHVHPLTVIVVTALGGLLGGIVGLILAVPAWVVATDALARARSWGGLEQVAQRAEPAVHRLME